VLIDWFTVAAQAVNFVVLVLLMKRFLFRPILKAIDAREQRIAKELADADAKEAEALRQCDEYQRRNQELERERAARLTEAQEAADTARRQLLGEVQREAELASGRRQAALRREAQNFAQALGRRTAEEVFEVARKALRDLAGVTLEERMTDLFLGRVRALAGPDKTRLQSALDKAHAPAVVRTAFDLTPGQRQAIAQTLTDAFGTKVGPRFETAPELISGVELTVDSQRLSWNVADYLASLEKGVDELLDETVRPAAKPAQPAGSLT